jgi:hypothetical protein
MNDKERAHVRMQDEQHAAQATRQTAQRVASSQADEQFKNPDFLRQLGEAGVQSSKIDWLRDEFPALLSASHVKGYRSSEYDEQAWLLDPVVIEEFIAERNPGRAVRQDEHLWALAQGIQGTEKHPDPTDNPDFEEPISSNERRVLRQLAEVASNMKSLSSEGKGFDGVAKVQTETRTIRHEDEEESLVGRVSSGVFG